jgi:hypothetical protein
MATSRNFISVSILYALNKTIMTQIKLKQKKHLGSGIFEYTYECFCGPKPLKDIIVTSGNDNEAKQSALEECDDYCSKNHQENKSSIKREGRQVLTIDEYFSNNQFTEANEKENEKKFKVVIEEVPLHNDKVKITPWIPSAGCLCEEAVEIPKSCIESVAILNQEITCCNKKFPLLELTLSEDATIPVINLFLKLSSFIERSKRSIDFYLYPHLQSNSFKSNLKITSLSQVNAGIYAEKKSLNTLEAWDYVKEVYVEGAHAHAGGRTTLFERFQLNDNRFKYEWNQEVLKKDDDTGWEFEARTVQDIEWRVWAQNCVFSCDEITLRIMYRVVPI